MTDADDIKARILETGRLPDLDWSATWRDALAVGAAELELEAVGAAALEVEAVTRSFWGIHRYVDAIPNAHIEQSMVTAIETDLRKLLLALYRRCLAAGAVPKCEDDIDDHQTGPAA